MSDIAGTRAEAHPDERMRFVSLMRRVPGAVAIVATASGDEQSGLAATAWNSLSADPPMLLACVNRLASAHALIRRGGAFSVNLLASNATEHVAIFSAQRELTGAARFLAGQWTKGPRGQPLLAEAIASFECTLDAMHDHGSHSILIGRVGEMRGRDGDALLYLDGSYASARMSG